MSTSATTLWFDTALLETGWADRVRLALEGGVIARIECGVAPGPADERGAVAVPGLPNVHSHAFQRAMAGLAERAGPQADSFWSWRQVMYGFLERLGPEDVETIAALAYIEMLECGFTQVAEFHYLHHAPDGAPYANAGELCARIVAGAETAGIGLTLLPVLYAHGNFGGAPPQPAQRRFLNDPARFARILDSAQAAAQALDHATVGLALHSLRAVTPAELDAALALRGQGPIHIHVAEQRREVEECIAWSGQRPLEWLLEHAPIDERWCLIHATHATEAELRAAAGRGCVIGLCPLTEANLGDGAFHGRVYLGAGGRIGIGTDSNVLIDAAEELRTLEYSQRLATEERNVLGGAPGSSTGRTLFEAALRGGGRALGGEPVRLAAGADADIVSLEAEHPALAGRRGDELLDAWIFAARAPVVSAVWRRGRRVVTHGAHIARAAVASRYRTLMRKYLR
ncbi:MAG TPA: formimidoylglutamate deiminase [Steroidobacteraceae bacterium]|nr:formimidoylglutamate deiminase [Steroidobacteraceae bacterium]